MQSGTQIRVVFGKEHADAIHVRSILNVHHRAEVELDEGYNRLALREQSPRCRR